MNILLIEDEILIQKSLKLMLEKRGAKVTAVSSGTEAIALIRENNFDRIISDLMLTDISGFDILEECKNIFSFQHISKKFIIITAYSSEQVLAKADSYGCKVLNKPFEDIAKVISIFLGE